jgi:hypothetical protein
MIVDSIDRNCILLDHLQLKLISNSKLQQFVLIIN